MDKSSKAHLSLNCGLDKFHNLCRVRAMSEETTQNMDGKRSFEERVFARFDALDSSVRDMEARLNKLEARSYDTKPIWEQALKEIIDTRRELSEQVNHTRQELSDEIIQTRREISKRLDRIEAIAHETRADLRDAEDRIERLEPKPTQ
jgi:chromosome segregation ATPase